MGLEFPILFVVVNLYCEFWNRLLHASTLLVSFYTRLLLAEPAEILLDVYFSIFVFLLLGHISLNLNWLIVCLLCMGFALYVYAWDFITSRYQLLYWVFAILVEFVKATFKSFPGFCFSCVGCTVYFCFLPQPTYWCFC